MHPRLRQQLQIEAFKHIWWVIFRYSHLLNEPVTNNKTIPGDFPTMVVHGNQQVGILYKYGSHNDDRLMYVKLSVCICLTNQSLSNIKGDVNCLTSNCPGSALAPDTKTGSSKLSPTTTAIVCYNESE